MNQKALVVTLAIHLLLAVVFFILSDENELLILLGVGIIFELMITGLSLIIRRMTKSEPTYFIVHGVIIIIISILFVLAQFASGWSGLGYILFAAVLGMGLVLSIPTYFIFKNYSS